MNYKKHYDLLVSRGQNRILEGYVEKHHIIPRCLGGPDEKSNIVILTPEEHYVAHQLLVKMYPNNRDLIYAAQLMTVHHTNSRINNKLFGWLRKQCAASMSQYIKNWQTIHGHPKGMLGKKHSTENISNITSGIKQKALEKRIIVYAYNLDGSFYKKYESLIDCATDLNTNASNVKYTADGKFGHCKKKQLRYEFSEKIGPYIKSSSLKGKPKTAEHRNNLSKAKKGTVHTKEWREQHSKDMKNYHARKNK